MLSYKESLQRLFSQRKKSYGIAGFGTDEKMYILEAKK